VSRNYLKICKLYLPREDKQCVESMRWKHMFLSIPLVDDKNIPINERRIYIEGLDFYESESKHPLPFATINGKKKTMENFWNEILGEKKHEDL